MLVDLRGKETISPSFLCRYIELNNGLRVLLISDFSGADLKGCGENGEDKGEAEDQGEEEEEDEGDSGEGSEEDEEDDEEAEQDSDFEELDEENAGKKKGSSEKQVLDVVPVPLLKSKYHTITQTNKPIKAELDLQLRLGWNYCLCQWSMVDFNRFFW